MMVNVKLGETEEKDVVETRIARIDRNATPTQVGAG